jgi:hypothetical protein
MEHRYWIIFVMGTVQGSYGMPLRMAMQVGAGHAKDWAHDLEGFPRDVIERVLTHWRQTEDRHPTPAGIIKRCWAEMRGKQSGMSE